MNSLAAKVRTALALGPSNLLRVFAYRAGVSLGTNPVHRLRASAPQGEFFAAWKGAASDLPASNAWRDAARYFGSWPVALGDAAPDWHRNPLNGARVAAPEREWWFIPDFDPALGDIKTVWEASRFDWVSAFAQQHRAGDAETLLRLNRWLCDWCTRNPPYRGPNWKCGQEASIRVLHLALVALLLDQVERPAAALTKLVELHLRRIEPTLGYAMAQDNNHGTSEAAALYVGGSWLVTQGSERGARWQRAGQRWLENRAARLIMPDGSFSQYSVNYHRIALDTLSLVEVWRRRLRLEVFSPRFGERARAATEWLYQLTDRGNGDAPNLGANDGARLIPLTDTDYRDHRPAVQLASVLFARQRAWTEAGTWDLPLHWLGIPLPEEVRAPQAARAFDDGGYALLRRGSTLAVLRYPRFRFRPGQSDALHLDLWRDGVNLLRDAGSYSYNAESEWLAYFPGTASHNTVQFDGRDQMPRIGRFLFGDWLEAENVEPLSEVDGEQHFGAGYRDREGARHHRRIALSDLHLWVEDRIGGFRRCAVLRWRLSPGAWRLDGDRVTDGRHALCVTASMSIVRIELVEGWESRYYLQKTPLPVLEVEVDQPGSIHTEYRFDV